MARVREIITGVEGTAAVTLRAHGLAPPAASPTSFCEAAMNVCHRPLVDSVLRTGPRVWYKQAVLGEFDPDVGDTPEGHSATTYAKMRFIPEKGWFVDELRVEDEPPKWPAPHGPRPPVAAD